MSPTTTAAAHGARAARRDGVDSVEANAELGTMSEIVIPVEDDRM
jgi:hypothetical protein